MDGGHPLKKRLKTSASQDELPPLIPDSEIQKGLLPLPATYEAFPAQSRPPDAVSQRDDMSSSQSLKNRFKMVMSSESLIPGSPGPMPSSPVAKPASQPVVTPAAPAPAIAKSEPVEEKREEPKVEDVEEVVEVAPLELDEFGVPVIELYCICQTPWDPNKFMIACDECDEWYHDKCLGRKEEDLVKLQNYVCPKCVKTAKRQKNRVQAKKAAKKLKTLCMNPDCSNDSPYNSKYCGRDCANIVMEILHRKAQLSRAANRIKEINATMKTDVVIPEGKELDQLIADAPKSATTNQDLALLHNLDSQLRFWEDRATESSQNLVRWKTRVKRVARVESSQIPKSRRDTKEKGLMMDCVTCGKSINMESYSIHVQECFEAREQYEHSSSEMTPGKCNEFNAQWARYCTHEKSICPFHSPEATAMSMANRICGYPKRLSDHDHTIMLNSEPLCLSVRSDCASHAGWEGMVEREWSMRLRVCSEHVNKVRTQIKEAKIRIARRALYSKMPNPPHAERPF